MKGSGKAYIDRPPKMTGMDRLDFHIRRQDERIRQLEEENTSLKKQNQELRESLKGIYFN